MAPSGAVRAKRPPGGPAVCDTQTFKCLDTASRAVRGKISRAHGGCLGTWSRRRTRQAAIIRGEGHTPDDPRVSEWANPPAEALASPLGTHTLGEDNPGN